MAYHIEDPRKKTDVRQAYSLLDLQPILHDLADRLAYTKKIYGGDASTYWLHRPAIDAQYDYNLQRAAGDKDQLDIADPTWNPAAYDDTTNEWMAHRYQETGAVPNAAERSSFFRLYKAEQDDATPKSIPIDHTTKTADAPAAAPQTFFTPQGDLQKPEKPWLAQDVGQGYTGGGAAGEMRQDGAGAGYRHAKNAGDVLYPNATINPGLPDDGFNPLSLHDWKTLAGDVGNKFKAGFYGAAAGLLGQPLNSLMGRDESVNIVIDGDRIGVLSTGNAGDKSDGKVRKKVPTDDGYTFVEYELTEEELAKRLGYGSVKALKLALVNEDDHIRFMNSENAFNDNIRHGIAAENKGVYDKAAGITGFAGSLLPGYGDGIDVKETITGEDIRTGEKLPLWQRGVTGAAMLLPIVSGGTIRSVIKGADEVTEFAEQTAKHGDELVEGAGKLETTRIGRWMSQAEYKKLLETGTVPESFSGTTHVASPANVNAFGKQAKPGSIYVEFDVPSTSIKPTSNGWAKITGPNSLEGRLALKKGLALPEMPKATNIKIVGGK